MDKKNDILQTYRQRKDEFHLSLREDGWQKLEETLVESPVRERHFPFRLLTVAAIGLVCVTVGLTLLFMKEETPSERLADLPPMETHPKELPLKSEGIDSSVVIAPAQKTFLPLVANRTRGVAQKDNLTPETEEVKAEETKAEESKTEEGKVEKKKEEKTETPSAANHRERYPVYPNNNKLTYARWAFGISSGTGNFSRGAGGISDPTYADQGPAEPAPPEEPGDQPTTKAAARGGMGGSSNNEYYQHNIPISVGLSIRRYLTRRIALESGLSYTYLRSDITYKNKTTGHQTVHYLGVPLKINWDLIQKEPFSLYLSGGGMVEHCLSARKNAGPMALNRWQYSLHGGIGVQYQVYRNFGFFAEPGVAYYINPPKEETKETIRSARPLTFNLQLGIRFFY